MPDDPQQAARVEDAVQHSQARIGRGLGALGGAALALGVLVLAGALEIGSMGLATPVVVGLGALAVGGVGAAMSAGSNLGADAGRQFTHDDGKIASGLPTLLVGPERRPLAHISSNANCDDHKHLTGGPWPDVVNAAQEQIAEGSGTVLVGPDFMPAARVGSQGTCGFTVGHGCPTVIIGGPTLRLLKVGDGDDPDKWFFDDVGTASGWIGIAGAALIMWPLGVETMIAGGLGAFLVGKAAGPLLNLVPEGAPRDAAALALAVLPLAFLPGMARGLSPNEGLKMGEGETPEGFASRVQAAKNARLEAEWRAKVEASKPRAGEIPLGPDGRPIPAYARARVGGGSDGSAAGRGAASVTKGPLRMSSMGAGNSSGPPEGGTGGKGDTSEDNTSGTSGSSGGGQGKLTGRPARINPDDAPENIQALTRENESAQTLVDHGYDVEQRPPTLPNGRNPDYRIDTGSGPEYYDNYAPTTPKARNIGDTIKEKVDKGQADRIVVNLNDSPVTPEQLQTQLRDWTGPDTPNLKEVLTIKNGQIIRVYP